MRIPFVLEEDPAKWHTKSSDFLMFLWVFLSSLVSTIHIISGLVDFRWVKSVLLFLSFPSPFTFAQVILISTFFSLELAILFFGHSGSLLWVKFRNALLERGYVGICAAHNCLLLQINRGHLAIIFFC